LTTPHRQEKLLGGWIVAFISRQRVVSESLAASGNNPTFRFLLAYGSPEADEYTGLCGQGQASDGDLLTR
jgi:hypothetical protein